MCEGGRGARTAAHSQRMPRNHARAVHAAHTLRSLRSRNADRHSGIPATRRRAQHPTSGRASDVGYCVGWCCASRSSFSMCMSVVLPALSRPRNRILAFLLAAQQAKGRRGSVTSGGGGGGGSSGGDGGAP